MLEVRWAELVNHWPEVLRQAVGGEATAQVVRIPFAAIEPLLKKGKVEFAWQQLCQWVRPPTAVLLRAMPLDTKVVIPLAFIAPLFMARRNAPKLATETELPESVPDLFQSMPGAPTEPVVPAAAPASAPPAAPTLAAPAPTAAEAPAAKLAAVMPALMAATPATESILAVPWAEVFPTWPEPTRSAMGVSKTPLSIQIPLSVLEGQLKSGRIQLAWKDVRRWVRPVSAAPQGPLAEDTLLEFPLGMVVPKFVNALKGLQAGQEVTPASEVPDLFEAEGQKSAPTPILLPEPPAGAPITVPPIPTLPPLATAPIPFTGAMPVPDREPPAPEPAPLPPPVPPTAPAPAQTPAAVPSLRLVSETAAPPAAPSPAERDWPLAIALPVAMLVASSAPSGRLPASHIDLEWFLLPEAWGDETPDGWPKPAEETTLRVPLARLEAALRSGVMEVSWSDLAAWARPAIPDGQRCYPPDRVFRIPLSLLADRYLRLRAQAAPGEAPADSPVSAPAPVAPTTPTTCHPGEFVSMLALIPGVEGALLASTDGLPVAAHLPTGLDRDAMSAFLPRLGCQVFALVKPFGVQKTDRVVYQFAELNLAVFPVDGMLVAVFGSRMGEVALQQVRTIVTGTRLT